jgi:hypothetical protein
MFILPTILFIMMDTYQHIQEQARALKTETDVATKIAFVPMRVFNTSVIDRVSVMGNVFSHITFASPNVGRPHSLYFQKCTNVTSSELWECLSECMTDWEYYRKEDSLHGGGILVLLDIDQVNAQFLSGVPNDAIWKSVKNESCVTVSDWIANNPKVPIKTTLVALNGVQELATWDRKICRGIYQAFYIPKRYWGSFQSLVKVLKESSKFLDPYTTLATILSLLERYYVK